MFSSIGRQMHAIASSGRTDVPRSRSSSNSSVQSGSPEQRSLSSAVTSRTSPAMSSPTEVHELPKRIVVVCCRSAKMPWFVMTAVILFAMGPLVGLAQVASLDFNQEGLANYCLYSGKAYSVGSLLCIPQSKTAVVCQASTEEPSRSGPARAVWKPKGSEIACK
jgi:hypothetical protein